MSLPKINLVVIGHKDHGKSTLIGRLLYDSKAIPEQKLQEIKDELEKSGKKEFEFAFILDSLEEERICGLTIDIMQTPFRSEKYLYTIIDCPGHKEFIKKMLTGASQADAAILVVSAKEGIEPQTKQHLFLIKTLGIRHLIVAVNKMDLVENDEETFKKISKDLRRILSTLGYSDAPIVPVSAYYGDNVARKSGRMAWYRSGSLIEVLDNAIKPPQLLSAKPLRGVIQDVYERNGERIVVCRVETGTLRTGQSVIVMPNMEEGVTEKIESFDGEVKKAFPGDSAGLILRGISNVRRGDVLINAQEKNRIKQTEEFVAQLIMFSDFTLKVGETVIIRIGTAEAKCKVQEILNKIDPISFTLQEENSCSLENGQVGNVLFRASGPLYLEEYSSFPQLGRFVIVGKMGAAAAGIVLKKRDMDVQSSI